MRHPAATLLTIFAYLAAAACGSPAPQVKPELPVVVEGVDDARGQQAVDSMYWYTGVRPDSVRVRKGVAHLAVPAGALGQRVIRVGDRCDVIRPPEGAFGEVARRARRVLGVDTIVVTQAQLLGEVRSWVGVWKCGDGPSLVRFDPQYLDAGEQSRHGACSRGAAADEPVGSRSCHPAASRSSRCGAAPGTVRG